MREALKYRFHYTDTRLRPSTAGNRNAGSPLDSVQPKSAAGLERLRSRPPRHACEARTGEQLKATIPNASRRSQRSFEEVSDSLQQGLRRVSLHVSKTVIGILDHIQVRLNS